MKRTHYDPCFNFESAMNAPLPRTWQEASKPSGLMLPIELSLEAANSFITEIGETQWERIYPEDLMNFYEKLKPEEKELFILKDLSIQYQQEYGRIASNTLG